MGKSLLFILSISFLLPAMTCAGQFFDAYETREFRFTDGLVVQITQLSRKQYDSRRKESMRLRWEPYRRITDYKEAADMLAGRLRIVQAPEVDYEWTALEVTFNDGIKRIFSSGGDKVEQYFSEYYPEPDVLILHNEADGEEPIDLNDSSKDRYVGNPKNHCTSPDGRLRITGYYPGGAADSEYWHIEKWNNKKGDYELLSNFELPRDGGLFHYTQEWFWTDNTTVLFTQGEDWNYEMKIVTE